MFYFVFKYISIQLLIFLLGLIDKTPKFSSRKKYKHPQRIMTETGVHFLANQKSSRLFFE